MSFILHHIVHIQILYLQKQNQLTFMKVKFYAVASIAVFFSAMLVNTKTFTNSTVPPPGYAGDPVNNQTCAAGSSCHGSNTQDGTSVISLQIGTSQNLLSPMAPSFVPTASTDYIIGLAINGTAQKYGFAVSALTSSNKQAGSFTITNTNGTIKNTANNIEYVTHKNATQTKSWFFKWTSPATISGPITFYATVNLANGNANQSGDAIYKRAVSINGGTSAISELKELTNITLYPNPATANITLNYNLLSNEYVSGQIMNSEGKVVKTLFGEKQNVGVIENTYNIADLAAGKYFVHISAAGKSTVKTLIKY
jgi:hypothetical protein